MLAVPAPQREKNQQEFASPAVTSVMGVISSSNCTQKGVEIVTNAFHMLRVSRLHSVLNLVLPFKEIVH